MTPKEKEDKAKAPVATLNPEVKKEVEEKEKEKKPEIKVKEVEAPSADFTVVIPTVSKQVNIGRKSFRLWAGRKMSVPTRYVGSLREMKLIEK